MLAEKLYFGSMANPDQMRIREPLISFFMGCWFVFLSTLGALRFMPSPFERAFVAVFCLVGLWMILSYGGVILDRRARTVTRWWGPLVPLRKCVRSLSAYASVAVSREVEHHSKGKQWSFRYVVRLEAQIPKDTLLLEKVEGSRKGAFKSFRIAKEEKPDAEDLEEAGRRRATEIGEFLSLPFRDLVEEACIPAHKEVFPPAALPVGCRIIRTIDGDGSVFDIPPVGMRIQFHHLLLATAALLWMEFVWTQLKSGPGISGTIVAVGDGLFLAAAVGSVFEIISLARTTERLRISPEGACLDRRTLFSTSTESIPFGRLRRLEWTKPTTKRLRSFSRCVSLRSDSGVLEFAAGLPVESQSWLRDAIRYDLFKSVRRDF